VLRALVPTAAGMTRMPYRPFALANAVGGTVWAVVVVLLGYTAGASLGHVQVLLGGISLGIGAVMAAVVTSAWVVARRRRSRRPPDGADAASEPAATAPRPGPGR
jgi:membrane protein DedA with SNARE-associated domain